MEVITKDNPTKEEYILGRILSMFGMRKIATDKVKKIMENDDVK
jgi:hypothetical protein